MEGTISTENAPSLNEGSGSESQQRCASQKRPGTPDLDGEKGNISSPLGFDDELVEIVTTYNNSIAERPFFVELGVGWSVDPQYATGREVKVFCPYEAEWYRCKIMSYCEKTGIHSIRFEDGKTTNIPLIGLKVRFCLYVKGPRPPQPSLARMKEIHKITTNGIKHGKYRKGYLPGIEIGLEKLWEAMVHEAYGMVHVYKSEEQEDLKLAESILKKGENITKMYKKTKMYLTLPRWLEPKDYMPGELVWLLEKGYPHWPCVVVSPDHLLGEGDVKLTNITSNTRISAYFLGSGEHQFYVPRDSVGFVEGLQKNFHKKKSKKMAKAWADSLVQMKVYAKARYAYLFNIFNVIFSDLAIVVFVQEGDLPDKLLQCFNQVKALSLCGQNDLPLKSEGTKPEVTGHKRANNEKRQTMTKCLKQTNGLRPERLGATSKLVADHDPEQQLKQLSNSGLRVHCLGKINWENPLYHSKDYIWPEGYKIERLMKSIYSEKQSVPHVIEILPAHESGEPQFRVTVRGDIKYEAKGSSDIFVPLLHSFSGATSASMYNEVGARLLGLHKSNILMAILSLPDADKCAGLSPYIKRKIPEPLPSPFKPSLTADPLLREMEMCRLPRGVKPVPLKPGRPFECQICGDVEEDEEDFILQCDKCKNCVHMSCYCVSEAPHGRLWLCDVCQSHPHEKQRPACIICPVEGGIMKRTTGGAWCHPACALWLPETAINREARHLHLTGLVSGIDLIHKSRLDRKCVICKQKYGAIIQCCTLQTECYSTFHFMCAKNAGCDRELVIESDGEEEEEDTSAKKTPSEDAVAQAPPPKRQRRKSEDKKGIRISCGRLTVCCPKHSGKSQTKTTNNSSNNDSNSMLDIDEYRYSKRKDVAAWISTKKCSSFFRKPYVQALAHTLGGPAPNANWEGDSAVPSVPEFKCLKFDDGLRCKPSMIEGIRTSIAKLQKPSDKAILSISDNYNRMSANWKKFILSGKSAIHGWGAFSTKKLKAGDMVIEYVGELVRPSVADMRERKMYNKLVGAGTYVFRLNTEWCVDATRSGNLAHLLNHSCSPNCASRTVSVKQGDADPVDYVIIFALQDIDPGEELTYDYRFCGEEILHCSCGAPECRGMVNQSSPDQANIWAPPNLCKPVNFEQLANNA